MVNSAVDCKPGRVVSLAAVALMSLVAIVAPVTAAPGAQQREEQERLLRERQMAALPAQTEAEVRY